MKNYTLECISFDLSTELTEFVNRNNIGPRQIQTIIKETYYTLFYWKRKNE